MTSKRSRWVSGIGAVLVVGVLVLVTGNVETQADDHHGQNPFQLILDKLDHILAAIGKVGGSVDLCNGGTTVGRFVNIGTTEVCDRTTGLTWQKTPDAAAAAKTYDQAVAWCHTPSATVAGGSRLPQIYELLSLVDYSQYQPALPVGIFTGVAIFGFYWSATPAAAVSGYAWSEYFGNGLGDVNATGNASFVWCVRGA